MDEHAQRQAGMAAGGKTLLGVDPVCGMQVFAKPNVISREHAGATYYFCCAGCAAKFDADPERFLARPGSAPMRPPAGATMPTMPSAAGATRGKLLGVDPVCGMQVFEKPGVISRAHAGTTYFFCGPRCAERFDADPAAILAAPGHARDGQGADACRSGSRTPGVVRPCGVRLPDVPGG